MFFCSIFSIRRPCCDAYINWNFGLNDQYRVVSNINIESWRSLQYAVPQNSKSTDFWIQKKKAIWVEYCSEMFQTKPWDIITLDCKKL